MLHRPRNRFPGSLATLCTLLLAACFYSNAPLLTASDYVQPARSGLWEELSPSPDGAWARLSAAEKRRRHCRTISGKHFCGKRVRIEVVADGSYRLEWEDEAEAEFVQVAALSGNRFIVQQITRDGNAEYALGISRSRDELELRLPNCDRDRYLLDHAAPTADRSSRCEIVDRESLQRLFNDFQARSTADDAKIYRRIAD